MKIYTRTGDRGQTSLGGGRRVSKDDPIIGILGGLDELNSLLGLVLSFSRSGKTRRVLTGIQTIIFNIGAEVSQARPGSFLPLSQEDVSALEKNIDGLGEGLKPLKNFILPRGSKASGFLHYARAVCRRLERDLVSAKRRNEVASEFILPFVNRLSDLLFVLSRYENQRSGRQEFLWRSQILTRRPSRSRLRRTRDSGSKA